MKYRFRDKLVLAFTLLLLVTIVPVLVLVNTQIESISSSKIKQDLQNTRNVFLRFQQNELKTYSEKAAVFINTQPEVRAEIATSGERNAGLFVDAPANEDAFGAVNAQDSPASSGSADAYGAVNAQDSPETAAINERRDPHSSSGGIGPPGSPPQPGVSSEFLADRQALILSVVEDVSLFKDTEIFFLADLNGKLIFNKSAASIVVSDLSPLSEVIDTLQGRENFTWWGSESPAFEPFGLIPESGHGPRLYQIFLKPVSFGSEVRGIIGIGFAMTRQRLKEFIGITQSEIGFLADGKVYLNSRSEIPATSLLRLTELASMDDEILRFDVNEEEFLALVVPIISTIGKRVGFAVVYRSKTKEMLVYDRLRKILNLIGLVALAVAGLLAFLISRNVTHALSSLHDGVGKVRDGDLDVQLELHSRDEFGEMGKAFNEMTAGLKEKEVIRDTFKRYVSSTVVDELLRDVDSIRLGGESKSLTIQFSDIVGFTGISELLAPEQVVEFLNEYLSRMTADIEAEGGIVDKYIGDAVMAFWGTPMPLENSALHGCRAALAQVGRIPELRSHWAERGSLSEFSIRIGLHTGDVVVGNIGSSTRMDYTIIGDNVNIASRLESINKVYGTKILISEETAQGLNEEFVIREIDLVRVAGRSEPITIFELIGYNSAETNQMRSAHERFRDGLRLFRQRKFKQAIRAFDAAQKFGQDSPARHLADRATKYLQNPPPRNWDGAYDADTK